MAILTKPHRPHHEMRAFGVFYGASIVATIVLHTLIAPVLPALIIEEYNAIVWTGSFLAASCSVAWWFERHRQRQARSYSKG